MDEYRPVGMFFNLEIELPWVSKMERLRIYGIYTSTQVEYTLKHNSIQYNFNSIHKVYLWETPTF